MKPVVKRIFVVHLYCFMLRLRRIAVGIAKSYCLFDNGVMDFADRKLYIILRPEKKSLQIWILSLYQHTNLPEINRMQ
jgi:hypothetical protein